MAKKPTKKKAQPKKDKEENPQHKEDFFSLLSKAALPKKPDSK